MCWTFVGVCLQTINHHQKVWSNFLSSSAHICGLMSNHLNFRMERIIALDPARPLIRPGNQNRLDAGDARSVQVIHTNAGYYGEGGRIGHIGK